jgi:glucose-6-phosphate 1-dehydrogenase
MTSDIRVQTVVPEQPQSSEQSGDPCILVLFGASGDLTKRLLMPALYNLKCDQLLPERFAIVGIALDELSTDEFRNRIGATFHQFNTRGDVDPAAWDAFARCLYYTPGNFADPAAYERLAQVVSRLDAERQTNGNLLFYLATPPSVFGLISANLAKAGLKDRQRGWTRIIVEKPFGRDLASAANLNRELLAHWNEDQIYRIDHYLGKETVQNLLAFRFANGIFEPLWNKNHIDHIQLTVSETVGVERRGGYYDKIGVLRDMIQNHMLQMLAYICMEPPNSFRGDAVRNEKAKLLEAVRVFQPEEVLKNTVRGQYGPGKKADGSPAPGYRQEPDVDPQSRTETFAALRLFIDNWRWEGVPVYLRSGKNLWKRGTEIVVQFKRAPDVIFRGTPAADRLDSNKLVFHVQPDQGIELRFHAKSPGPSLYLQKVDMRFDYREAFEASRGTGYEVLLYHCMIGDPTLFSRADLVESAWGIAQPILDAWANAAADDFPNYAAGSWGPKAAFDIIARDGRRWVEVVNRGVLEKVSLFKAGDPVFLHAVSMMLKPMMASAGDSIVREGEMGSEMYFICRGAVEVRNQAGTVAALLGEGDFFGEMSLLSSQPRNASVRAVSPCDLFVLSKSDLDRVLRDYPEVAGGLRKIAAERAKARGLPPG